MNGRSVGGAGGVRGRVWLGQPAMMLLLVLASALGPRVALAAGDTSYVAAADGPGRFALARAGRSAPLYVDAGADPGVVRALRDLRADIGRVTGAEPALLSDAVPAAAEVVLAGTLGRSPVLDRLAREGKLDVEGIQGRWETFALQVVEDPLPGVKRALVIAGSDKRGTIFGIYDLSREIGVSPWYWWADVPVARRDRLFVLPGRHTRGEPAVKYRGIFINDEAPALAGWAHERFGGFNHRFYANVYELILRLQGNYLWPAMWGRSLYDDDPENARLADEYGVVVGTSHHEPMMRAHVEWSRYGSGPWSYEANTDALRAFWRRGIERMGPFESLVTVGMRGDGDEPMSEQSNIALLERIVADQRQIIGEVTGEDPAATPQVWALYKEVQDYYDRGMRVPDDVTLLFADDNWGNIRRLPALGDSLRAGGFGVYYHFDYVGGPRNYKWLNTTQIERVWEQMHLAHRYGANRLWIVNVGDIKPMELPTEFFLDYAWDPERWPAESLPGYTRRWAERQFGGEHAAEIAEILSRYTQYNSRRKPELLDTTTYSLTHYREAERVVDDYRRLAERARRINEALPAEYRDAFYQLVLYPVEASANLNELYVTVARNRLYARQGRSATNQLADHGRALFERDAELTRRYHEEIAGGKWNHMMSQTHIGYTYWQEPPRNVMPRVDVIHVRPGAEMAVAIEGSERVWPMERDSAVLPEMDVFQRQSRYLEVFNRGDLPFEYSIEAGAPWLSVSPARGTVSDEQRAWVSVDWSRAPRGRHRVPLTVAGPGGRKVVVHAEVFNPGSPRRDRVTGFVEGNGYVSMEAQHHSRAVASSPLRWQRVPGLGRTLSGMTAVTVTAPRQSPGGNSPRLEYRMHLFSGGEVEVHAYLSPTLSFQGTDGLRYAVSIDDEPPQIINMHADGAHVADNGNRPWEQMVADNVKVVTSRHRIDRPGEHVLKFWLVDPGVVLQKLVVDTGGLEPSYLGPPESYHRPER